MSDPDTPERVFIHHSDMIASDGTRCLVFLSSAPVNFRHTETEYVRADLFATLEAQLAEAQARPTVQEARAMTAGEAAVVDAALRASTPMVHVPGEVTVQEAARVLLGGSLGLAQEAAANGWHRAKIVDGWPNEGISLVLPLNDPCTGDTFIVGSLSVEDSGVAPALWEIAIAALRALSEDSQ